MISISSISDAEQIVTLVNSAYRGESGRKGWTTEADLLDGTRIDLSIFKKLIIKKNVTILKYEEKGIIKACVELRIDSKNMYLGMLTVSPELQNKGIGKKMLQASEDFAYSQKCQKIYMTVISVRKELIDWYIRHGYINTGIRKPFQFEDPGFGIPKRKLEFTILEKQLI